MSPEFTKPQCPTWRSVFGDGSSGGRKSRREGPTPAPPSPFGDSRAPQSLRREGAAPVPGAPLAVPRRLAARVRAGRKCSARGLASPAPWLPDDVTAISLEGCVTPGRPSFKGTRPPVCRAAGQQLGRSVGSALPWSGGMWPLLLDAERAPGHELLLHSLSRVTIQSSTEVTPSLPPRCPETCGCLCIVSTWWGEAGGARGAASSYKGIKCHRGVPTLEVTQVGGPPSSAPGAEGLARRCPGRPCSRLRCLFCASLFTASRSHWRPGAWGGGQAARPAAPPGRGLRGSEGPRLPCTGGGPGAWAAAGAGVHTGGQPGAATVTSSLFVTFHLLNVLGQRGTFYVSFLPKNEVLQRIF